MKILGISGSLRRASGNSRLLAAVAACSPEGVAFEIADCLDRLPHFNPDVDPNDSEVVSVWVRQVKAADGIVISTPEYARGYPGTLKNALDWLVPTDAHIDRPFVLMNASARSTVAQRTLVTVLETMSGIHIEPATTTIPLLGKDVTSAGVLENPEWRDKIERSLDLFVREIRRLAEERGAA